ncbi:MAG: hypothetical protein L6R39_005145 [Caloplaca ligustica]|nr:MAG: hypothetical protein L6R39_005145 [Caloplaca ligustica]
MDGSSVSGVFTVGPVINLDAEADLGISVQRQMLAGVNISIPNFHADLVLVSVFESRTSAFAIDVKHIFEANAQIAAHAGLGLSLLIGMGVIIPPINFKKTVSINDKPSIEANMTYTASKICTGLSEDDSYAKGVKYRLDFLNNAYVDLFVIEEYDP